MDDRLCKTVSVSPERKKFLYPSLSRGQHGQVVSASDLQSSAPRVQVPLWPLAGFVLARSKLKSLAKLVNSQLVASCQLGLLILLCCI